MKIEAIISQFQIEGKVVKKEPIEIGLINQTWLVVSQSGECLCQYVLQKINTYVFKEPAGIMSNIAEVASHLLKKEYPIGILQAIKTKEGKDFLQTIADGCWRLFPFFQNTFSVNEVEDETLAYEAAYCFGEYARYLSDLDVAKLHTPIPDFHNTPLRFQYFKRAIQQGDSERLVHAEKEIDQLLELRWLLQRYAKFARFIRTVHYDTKINNVLFDKQTKKPKVILDLDTLMPGLLPYDFGDMVRTYTPPVDENEAIIEKVFVRNHILKAITDGYLDGIKDEIHPDERSNLNNGAALIIYEQALRFLSDYLVGDRYYQVRYTSQNLVRAKNQIALLNDFLSQIKLVTA